MNFGREKESTEKFSEIKMFHRVSQRLVKLTSNIDRYQLCKNWAANKQHHTQLRCMNTTFKMKILNSFDEELKLLSGDMKSANLLNSKITFNSVTTINKECCKALSKMNFLDILRTLNMLHRLSWIDITTMEFYKNALDILRMRLTENALSTQEVIQFLYFSALRKIDGASDANLSLQYLSNINELSLLEQYIIAKAAIETKIKLKSQLTSHFEKTFSTMSKQILQETDFLLLFCVVLSLNDLSKNFTLSEFSLELVHHPKRFDIPVVSNVLRLYLKMNLADTQVLNRFVGDIIMQISKLNRVYLGTKNPTNLTINPIYINYTLKALGKLSYNFDFNESQEINLFINNIFGLLTREPNTLVNILLYLWILQVRLEGIIIQCFRLNIFQNIIESKSQKHQARLFLLLNCIRIETPHVYIPQALNQSIKAGFPISNAVKQVHQVIESLSNRMQLDNVKVHCPAEGINIPGITFQHPNKGLLHIDILDEKSCLKFTNLPHGFLKLKLRLLKKLNYTSIMVNGSICTKDSDSAFIHVKECVSQVLFSK